MPQVELWTQRSLISISLSRKLWLFFAFLRKTRWPKVRTDDALTGALHSRKYSSGSCTRFEIMRIPARENTKDNTEDS